MRKVRFLKSKKICLVVFGLFLLCTAGLAFLRMNASAEDNLAEINPDDWRLEAFFLDIEADNGRNPVRDATWDTGELSYSNQVNRIYTLQVNYHNENMNQSYQPGELQLRVPNPFANIDKTATGFEVEAYSFGDDPIDSEDPTHDWFYNSDTYLDDGYFVFTNRVPFEAQANVEGSVQITFNLFSKQFYQIDEYPDKVVKTFTKDHIQATLNNNPEVVSNEVSFTFKRTSIYNWRHSIATIQLTPDKVYARDDFYENAGDYIWVRWRYAIETHAGARLDESHRADFIGYSDYSVTTDSIPQDVVILQKDPNISIARDDETGITTFTSSGYCTSAYFYIGYPRSIYNEAAGTNIITQDIDLNTIYSDGVDWFLMDDDEKTIDLSLYDFIYEGNVVGIEKEMNNMGTYNDSDGIYAQQLRKENIYLSASIHGAALDYTGEEYTLIINDDLLYSEDAATGETQRVSESNYYFTTIGVNPLIDANNERIGCDEYTMKVYARQRGSSDYSLKYTSTPTSCSFSSRSLGSYIADWYVEYSGLRKPVKQAYISTRFVITVPDAPDNGFIHNFARIQQTKNGVVQNVVGIESYANERTRNDVADFDLATYGSYQQRAVATMPWTFYTIPEIKRGYSATAFTNTPEYNVEDDVFYGEVRFRGAISDYNEDGYLGRWYYARDQFDSQYLHKAISLYGILPKGAVLDSTPEELIADFMPEQLTINEILGANGGRLFRSYDEAYEYFTTHMSVEITENWRNNGSTKIHYIVDFSDKPFTTFDCQHANSSRHYANAITMKAKYHITYDTYRELGLKYDFYAAIEDDWEDKSSPLIPSSWFYKDDNRYGEQYIDINENGMTNDFMAKNPATATLLPVVSSKQDITTYVKSDDDAQYNTIDTRIEPGDDYSYKLRLRNSTSRITNAVIYTNIEEAYGDNPHWSGAFLGVDTTYAESQKDNDGNPLTVKVYWSPKADAKSLSNEEDGWSEYDEATTDKTLIKSLAFQYLDMNGNPAVLPVSNYSYVLVKMRSPSDDGITTYAFNKSFSEWNPIDNLNGEIMHQITGIESNVVRVYFRQNITATAKIIWDDDCDDGNRPSELSFRLFNGDDLIEEKTINVATDDYALFEGLDIVDRENYRIEIDSIEPYIVSLDIDGDTLTYAFTATITCPSDPDPEPEPTPNPDPDPDPTPTPTPEPEPETPEEPNTPDIPNTYDSILINSMTVVLFATASVATVAYAKRRKN